MKRYVKNFHNRNQVSFLHFSNSSHVPLCSHVTELHYQERCNFIQKTTECHSAVHYFDSLNFIFCTVGPHESSMYIIGILIVCVLCLYLFTILATTADKFFCPALAVISKILKMGETLAGVTLLAFGNGSPDIFSSLAHTDGDTELMYTELLGAAAFVTGFIGGFIILTRPFKIVHRNYVRDVLFFIAAIVLIDQNIHDQRYSLGEGFATVAVYILYIIYVFADHIFMKKKMKKLRKRSSTISASSEWAIEIQRKAADLEEIVEIQIKSRRTSAIIGDPEIQSVYNREVDEEAHECLFENFVKAVNPINADEWKHCGKFSKVLIAMKSPIVFVLLLIVPIVDYGEELHGWSKPLNMLHIFTLPQFFLFVTGNISMMFFHALPLAVMVLLISIGLSVAVFVTSRVDRPPKYHVIFAVGSFVGSICVIYVVAKEVVSVMKTIGVISDMSDSMVGLSILAWGNSIGDLFSNITLAKQGYQQMAFAACFGGPMLNSLLGVGLTFIVKAFNTKSNLALAREGAMGPNCAIFMILNLSFAFIAVMFTKFRARRSIGIYMIAMYLLFIFYSLLGEFEVIHPYGTDHKKT